MNLTKLFEMQRQLDERIMEEHPEIKGQNNLDWKILALQVELGECANEWRGFKKWSHDQYARTFRVINNKEYNPLLEEYVDCLHFILSIGLEIGYVEFDETVMEDYFKYGDSLDITGQFITLNWIIGNIFENTCHYEQALFELIRLGEMLGFTWEQIEQAYYAKNAINHARQEAGY